MVSYSEGTSGYSEGTSSYIWDLWTSSSCDATSTSTSDYYRNDSTIWTNWTSDRTQATISYSSEGTIWSKWSSTYKVPIRNSIVFYDSAEEEKTTEQRRAEKAQMEINEQWSDYQYEEMKREKEEAEDLALELLSDIIGEDQMLIYKETGRIVVHGQKHDWLLRKGRTIVKLEGDKAIGYCVHLRDRQSYPETDNIIALALHLKTNEERLEKTANRNYPIEEEVVEIGGEAKVIKYDVLKRRVKINYVEDLAAASF